MKGKLYLLGCSDPYPEYNCAEYYPQADLNKDNYVSLKEAWFAEKDTNRNGKIRGR